VVPLPGPGGCGKTRLALRVASLAAGGFGDGARLASPPDPRSFPASVLAVRAGPGLRWQAGRADGGAR